MRLELSVTEGGKEGEQDGGKTNCFSFSGSEEVKKKWDVEKDESLLSRGLWCFEGSPRSEHTRSLVCDQRRDQFEKKQMAEMLGNTCVFFFDNFVEVENMNGSGV